MTAGNLNLLDYSIFFLYFSALIFMSWIFSKGQKTEDDYFVSGRNMPWWAIGISTMATQTSAIGFISIPAFVALKQGGGLKIIQGEFVLPISMIFIMVFLIPFFRKLNLISVYQYLEMRFGSSVKYLIAGVFLISRGLGTAVGLYMTAIVFSTVFGLSLWMTIVIIGVITLVYDTLGGMKAVIYSDVIQMFILLIGAFLIIWFAMDEIGGISVFSNQLTASMGDRLTILDFKHHGFGDGGDFSFWPQFFGGFFLLASYYGCDQTQTQRELSAKNISEVRNSLILNGFARFPLLLLYSAIGLTMGVFVANNLDFSTSLQAYKSVDYMLPVFIMNYLPHGIKAIIFVAVLAAAMSSLDSSINSLSASTLIDFIKPWKYKNRPIEHKTLLKLSKLTTIAWGVLVTLLAFIMGGGKSTVVELINMIGSAFYGPILAAFLAGVCFRRITTLGIFIGIIFGVFFNGILHFFFKDIFWMWWNMFGTINTVIVAFIVSFLDPNKISIEKEKFIIWNTDILSDERAWIWKYALLVLYVFIMIGICLLIPKILNF